MSSLNSIDRSKLGEKLLKWWVTNQRKFPWRETHDPYRILVSELLLHRTRAEQVAPVYTKFVEKYPRIEEAAASNLDEVKKLLHPLGLLWRTKLLHELFVLLLKKYQAKIPLQKDELESLPGISHYIAGAVRCFAFGCPEPLLDTNTVRVLGRIFELQVTPESRRSKLFQEKAELILDRKNCRKFNYALIDLGALICRPKKPLCNKCPLNKMCRMGLRLASCTHL